MKLFIIILSAILFHRNYISGIESEELSSIDVIATLKAKDPDCKLQSFVISDDDYTKLESDLTTYCSTSDSTKQNALICRMVHYELEKACKLSIASRPTKSRYIIDNLSAEICKANNVPITSDWILNKITQNGKINIGVTAAELCPQVASNKDTLRLTRFFYKIAPRVRKSDVPKQKNDG